VCGELGRGLGVGARPAEPGEFLRRAFEHGKIDLAQAEAVAAAVSAQTEQAHRAAQQQFSGALSLRIAEIRAPLVAAATELNADIEFPDEDLGRFDPAAIAEKLRAARAAIGALLGGFRAGRLLAEGATVAIVGPPNAGKSSLLNALVGFERAIVSPVAGTTRDTVEERTVIGGAAVRFVDTAGLRETEDAIEAAGVARARAAMQRADAVLAVVSADTDWAGFVRTEASDRVIWVWNKADAAPVAPAWVDVAGADALSVSAQSGAGLLGLRQALEAALLGAREEGLPLVTLERHAVLLREAGAALAAAIAAVERGASAEVALVDVGISIHRLSALLGENLGEEVYREIFRRFCIGK
jgi:tRNA modification GTPase